MKVTREMANNSHNLELATIFHQGKHAKFNKY